MSKSLQSKTGGRAATTGVIAGRFALSVGQPDMPTPKGWTWTPLLEVARLESGHTPSRKHPEYWDGEIPWIGIKDATENHGRTIYDTYQHTNDLGIANSAARLLPTNTVCLSRTASVGYVIVMGVPMATSQDFVNWVCVDSKLDYRYLKYVLVAEKESMLSFASGTTHQTIYFPEVKAFNVCLPPIDEQREIASLLSDLDQKIELEESISLNLEQIGKLLFDELVTTSIASNTATEKCLRELCTHLNRGISPRYIDNDGVVVLNQKCIRNKTVDFSKARRHDHTLKSVVGKEIQLGDILVNSTGVGTLGRIAQVLMLDEMTIVDSHITIVRPDTNVVTTEYLGFELMGREIEVEKLGAGSTGQTELSRERLGQLKLKVPPLHQQVHFSEKVKPLNEQRVSSSREIATLRGIRDLLLPKLITGQVRLRSKIFGASI